MHNTNFHVALSNDIAEEINIFEGKEKIIGQLETLWSNRQILYEKSQKRREANKHRWDWDARVNEMISILNDEGIL